MCRYGSALVFVFLIASASRAQDAIQKDFTPQDVQAIVLKQVMKVTPGKPDRDGQRKVDFYGTPDNEYDLEHHYAEKKFVWLYVFNDNLKLPADKVNVWNGLGMQTRAYHNQKGQTVLAGVLYYDAGLSVRQLLTFHLRLKAEKQAFEGFAKK